MWHPPLPLSTRHPPMPLSTRHPQLQLSARHPPLQPSTRHPPLLLPLRHSPLLLSLCGIHNCNCRRDTHHCQCGTTTATAGAASTTAAVGAAPTTAGRQCSAAPPAVKLRNPLPAVSSAPATGNHVRLPQFGTRRSRDPRRLRPAGCRSARNSKEFTDKLWQRQTHCLPLLHNLLSHVS